MKHIVIIGNGIAGITAARHIRKRSSHTITVISSETEHFYARTALMYIYMGHMTYAHTKPYEDSFWKKNRIDLVFDHASGIDTNSHTVTLKSGCTISFDNLVIACGSQSRFLDWPGQHLRGVQGLYSYPDLLAMEHHTRNVRNAVVVGGGLIGVEMAEMLRSRDIDVAFLIREPAVWNNVLPDPDARLISRHIASHGVRLQTNDTLREVVDDGHGAVGHIVTGAGNEIACDFVGIAVGVHPNVAWLRDSTLDIGEGIRVNRYLETNVPGIFAIGDCVERTYALPGRKSVEQVWYTARMMGEVVAQTLCGERTPYEPGPWFNSAKFFDIEFQTYGTVNATRAEDEADFYWEDTSGTKAIHLVWNAATRTLTGVNSFGIRLRHECFDRWLREHRTVDYTVQHLAEANFDPEFANRYDRVIQSSFQQRAAPVASHP